MVEAELPERTTRLNLSKRNDIIYGAAYAASHETLAAVHIVGYLRSDRDQTTRE